MGQIVSFTTYGLPLFFMPMKSNIKIKVSLDPNKQCLRISGDGSASITFITDATQLANAIRTVAQFKGKLIELSMKGLSEGCQNGRKKTNKRAKISR